MKQFTTAYVSKNENMFLSCEKNTSIAELHDFAMELRAKAIDAMKAEMKKDMEAMEVHKETKEKEDSEDITKETEGS